MRQQLCSLSSPVLGRHVHSCSNARYACFGGEQIFLHGPDAKKEQRSLLKIMQGVDLFDIKRPFVPSVHNVVQLAAPGDAYDYVPLAVNAWVALNAVAPGWNVSSLRNGTRNISASRFAARRRQPMAPFIFSNASTALAFITTWSNAWQETFHRAVSQVFEEFCSADGGVTVVPAIWGSSGSTGNAATSASATTWLAPFSQEEVIPMALMPSPERVQQQLFGNKPCNRECFASYVERSEAFFAERPPRCFERLRLCSFQATPAHARPWSAIQTLAAYHTGMPANRSYIPRLSIGHGRLRVVFIIRQSRRRIANIDELVEACSRWRPSDLPKLHVDCAAHSLAAGLQANAPLLRDVDVLVGMHGGDMVNGLLLHAGASVLEILPVHRAGCPCDVFRKVYSSERGKVLHYTATSQNTSYVRGVHASMHSDMVVPAHVVEVALEHIAAVRGDPERYRFREFAF